MRGFSRREFVLGMARAGGIGAAYLGLQSFGALASPAVSIPTPKLAAGSGHGKTILILGAGIAGLVSAYELGKAGYRCIVLEARERAGGRNWTMRGGTRVDMLDGTTQICTFGEGLYFNAGPGRLPSFHTTMLGYCREFGVPLEVEVNMSRSALLQDDASNGGKPIQMRQAVADTRGWIAELLAKSAQRGALDAELSGDDLRAFYEFLVNFGDLDKDYRYKGSERAGFAVLPGAGEIAGQAHAPLPLKTLLDPTFWRGELYDENVEWQPTMFQPIGGMDRIVDAFRKHVGHTVRYRCEVQEVVNERDHVRVSYLDSRSGQVHSLKGDACICTLPPPILKGIRSNFADDFRDAIGRVPTGNSNKVAWEAPRFWEAEDQIYGGISFVNRDPLVVWYPSAGLFTERGVLVGTYNFGEFARRFAGHTLEERFRISREAIDALHPGNGAKLEKPVTLYWNHVPYSRGPWTEWHAPNSPPYLRLIQPEGRVYLAGEHVSHVTGWQEGAALSAQRVLGLIAQRLAA